MSSLAEELSLRFVDLTKAFGQETATRWITEANRMEAVLDVIAEAIEDRKAGRMPRSA